MGQVQMASPKGAISSSQLWIGYVVAMVVLCGALVGFAVTGSSPSHASPVAMPRVLGESRIEARATLQSVGLQGHIRFVFNSPCSIPANVIVAQSPAPGTVVRRGSTVRLVANRGLSSSMLQCPPPYAKLTGRLGPA